MLATGLCDGKSLPCRDVHFERTGQCLELRLGSAVRAILGLAGLGQQRLAFSGRSGFACKPNGPRSLRRYGRADLTDDDVISEEFSPAAAVNPRRDQRLASEFLPSA